MHLTGVFVVLAAALCAASPMCPLERGFKDAKHSTSIGGKAKCIEGFVAVTATSSLNVHLSLDIPRNQSVATQYLVNSSTSGAAAIASKPFNVSGTFSIYSRLCYPAKSGIKGNSIQILTHGLGFDNRYWDFEKGYSFVDTAAMNGHATFAYDRLGVGRSEKPKESIQVVQAPLEAEIAHELVRKLRAGKLASTSFQNVVGVGHSFGSEITASIASSYPKSVDAIILTGFSLNTTGEPVFTAGLNLQIASKNNPKRFRKLNNGYLVADSRISNQFAFFHEPGYPPEHLDRAEQTKGTVALGELLAKTGILKPSPTYTGGIAVVNGAQDLPFCGGNCRYPTNLAAAVKPALFPNAKKSMTYLAPAAGHGLNVHYSAPAAFEKIQSFIKSNGL